MGGREGDIVIVYANVIRCDRIPHDVGFYAIDLYANSARYYIILHSHVRGSPVYPDARRIGIYRVPRTGLPYVNIRISIDIDTQIGGRACTTYDIISYRRSVAVTATHQRNAVVGKDSITVYSTIRVAARHENTNTTGAVGCYIDVIVLNGYVLGILSVNAVLEGSMDDISTSCRTDDIPSISTYKEYAARGGGEGG